MEGWSERRRREEGWKKERMKKVGEKVVQRKDLKERTEDGDGGRKVEMKESFERVS